MSTSVDVWHACPLEWIRRILDSTACTPHGKTYNMHKLCSHSPKSASSINPLRTPPLNVQEWDENGSPASDATHVVGRSPIAGVRFIRLSVLVYVEG